MQSHVRESSGKRPNDRKYQGVPLENDCHLSINVNDVSHANENHCEEGRAFGRLVENGVAEIRQLDLLTRDIREIKTHCAYMMKKQLHTEKQDKIIREWKLVAIVLDRFFFFVYLIVMLVSISTVFDFVLFGKDGNSSQD